MRRLLILSALCVSSVVATVWGAERRLDVVDYIVKGDAQSALKGFSFPFKHNDLYPLVREIKTHDEFVRLFPIMFDAETRKILQSKQGKTGGWDFKNWQGEMFGDGDVPVGRCNQSGRWACISYYGNEGDLTGGS